MARRLPTYLRTYRKRFGLRQDELSYLLGCQSGSSVSEYERSTHQPSLETAVACSAVFGVSVEELFPGIYEKVEKDVIERSRQMSEQLPEGSKSPVVKLKRRLFEAIGRRHRDENQNNVWKREVTTSPAY